MNNRLPMLGLWQPPETASIPDADAAEIARVLAPLEATVTKSRGCYQVTIPKQHAKGVETTYIGASGAPLVALVREIAKRQAAA